MSFSLLWCYFTHFKKKSVTRVSPEGTLFLSHTPSFSNLSRISQLNMPGFSLLYSSIFLSTSGVAVCFDWRKGEMSLYIDLNPFPHKTIQIQTPLDQIRFVLIHKIKYLLMSRELHEVLFYFST